jgi:hypothetical protein
MRKFGRAVEAADRLESTLLMLPGTRSQVLMNNSQATTDVSYLLLAVKGWVGNFGRPFSADNGKPR